MSNGIFFSPPLHPPQTKRWWEAVPAFQKILHLSYCREEAGLSEEEGGQSQQRQLFKCIGGTCFHLQVHLPTTPPPPYIPISSLFTHCHRLLFSNIHLMTNQLSSTSSIMMANLCPQKYELFYGFSYFLLIIKFIF